MSFFNVKMFDAIVKGHSNGLGFGKSIMDMFWLCNTLVSVSKASGLEHPKRNGYNLEIEYKYLIILHNES
jgi:hypothetical protein